MNRREGQHDDLSRLAESKVEVAFSEPSRAITISPLDPYVSDEIITMLVMPMIELRKEEVMKTLLLVVVLVAAIVCLVGWIAGYSSHF